MGENARKWDIPFFMDKFDKLLEKDYKKAVKYAKKALSQIPGGGPAFERYD